MDRDAITTAVVALLAVLALALGAATLDPLEGGSGLGTSEGDVAGPGEGSGFQLGGQPRNASDGGSGPSVPPLVGRLVLAMVLFVALIGLYSLYKRLSPREAAWIVGGIAAVALFVYLTVRLFGDIGFPGGNGTIGRGPMELPGGGGSGVSGDDSGISLSDPPFVLLAAFGLVLVGGAVVALRSAGGGSANPEPDPESEPDEEAAAIGRAAGRAADRINAETDADNEIYRAWEEMTDHLDVANPRASTPEEFATAAIDAGMHRSDVAELTDLFRRTRYGGRAVTDDRTSRAVAALRRIEEEYAPDEASASIPDRDGPERAGPDRGEADRGGANRGGSDRGGDGR